MNIKEELEKLDEWYINALREAHSSEDPTTQVLALSRRANMMLRQLLPHAMERALSDDLQEELEQYRALGTVGELKEGLEELGRYQNIGGIDTLEEMSGALQDIYDIARRCV